MVPELIDISDSDSSDSEDFEAKAIRESYDMKCNEKLMKSAARIKAENKALAARIPALMKEIEMVKSENKRLQNEKKVKDAMIVALTKKNESLDDQLQKAVSSKNYAIANSFRDAETLKQKISKTLRSVEKASAEAADWKYKYFKSVEEKEAILVIKEESRSEEEICPSLRIDQDLSNLTLDSENQTEANNVNISNDNGDEQSSESSSDNDDVTKSNRSDDGSEESTENPENSSGSENESGTEEEGESGDSGGDGDEVKDGENGANL